MEYLPWAATILAALINTILGFFTYYKNPKSQTNRSFASFTLTLALYLFINQLSLAKNSPIISLFWMRTVMVLAVVLNISFYLLVHVFPEQKRSISRRKKLFLYSFTAIMGILAASPLLFSGIDIENFKPIPGPAMPLFLLHTIFFLGGGVVSLVRKLRKSKGLEKAQIRFVFVGALLMFLLIIITNVVLVFAFNNSSFVGLLPLYTTFFAGSLAYAIVRHKLLDVNAIVSRAVTYAFLVIITTFLYAGSLLALADLAPESSHQFITIALAVILAFTFNPLRKIIQKSTDKLLFKKSYDSNVLLDDLGDITTSTLSLKTISQKVLKKLIKTLQINKAVFIFIQTNHKVESVSMGFNDSFSISKTEIKNITKKAKTNPLAYEDITSQKIKQIYKNNDFSVVLPLENSGKIYGLLALGHKKSGDIFSTQDLNTLDIFGPQISVAIQNSLAYEKIRQFNITLREEVKLATKKLRKANKDLRHLDKLKDEFVYVATHELKNPVTAMRGYLSMINEGSFGRIPKQLQEPIVQLNQSNQQLVNLVNDLLQIARAEAQTLNVDLEDVNICKVIEEIIKNIQPLADQKDIKINYSCSKKEILIKADSDRLKEVFNNLISNAIKYSEKGTIAISYAQEGKYIATHVKDQGVGIPKKDQKKIFTRFFRVEEEAAKGIPGSGLGLFIVRQLVEKMGGKIWFTSKYGKGTTFSFTLPKA
ncbi:ATP-binding protein [Patescibacteria group bacterium]